MTDRPGLNSGALADPKDWISRANRNIALYDAGRWEEAAAGFEADVAREGIESPNVVPALFCIGYCRLQLGDPRGSLAATTAFLDLGNTEHPFYADGIENTACAWEALDQAVVATSLRRGGWDRDRVLRTSFELLGLKATPRPPRDFDWYAEPEEG